MDILTANHKDSGFSTTAGIFFGSQLLSLAHLLVAIALVRFGYKVGSSAINPLALTGYATVVVASLVALCVQSWWGRKERRTPNNGLLWLSLPLVVIGVFCAALWSTAWLGDAPYAPWEVGDDDTVHFISVVLSLSWIVVAISYGSYSFLFVGACSQIGLYFVGHALPHGSRFPGASMMGVDPTFPEWLVLLFLLGALVIAIRRQLLPDSYLPLWVGALFITAVSGWLLVELFNQFPPNGMTLGWTRDVLQVPADAWNWVRPAVPIVVLAAVIAGPITVLISHRTKESALR